VGESILRTAGAKKLVCRGTTTSELHLTFSLLFPPSHPSVPTHPPKMCPHATTPNANEEMVAIDMSGSTAVNGVNSDAPNGTQNLNGHTVNGDHANGHAKPRPDRQRHNPYAPRASDFLNNISNFKIIESTLRGTSPFPTRLSHTSFLMILCRGRAIRQRILRHQDQDCDR
jgi:hypothetical protein